MKGTQKECIKDKGQERQEWIKGEKKERLYRLHGCCRSEVDG